MNLNLYEQYEVLTKHEAFMQYFWLKKNEPLIVGIHTRYICQRIDKAICDFDRGKSSYILITVPFRHGKSDIVSRYLPAHFIGLHPDCDVMVASYQSGVAEGFTSFSRDLVARDDYYEIFKQRLSQNSASRGTWKLDGHVGVVTGAGLSSGITGKGYHLGILDDFCSSRAEAESKNLRNKLWESFTNDFFTRQAPVSITIILATPWHVDDIIGRIKALNSPENEGYDPEFQKFEVFSFPAIDGDIVVTDYNTGRKKRIKYDYLFTKDVNGKKGRFEEKWYKRQAAALGEYGTASLLQCNPQIRGGNLFEMGKLKFHDTDEDFPKTKYYRVWDYAHTAKQTQKEDPDWTSGTLLTYTKIEGVWHLWIKDVSHFRGKSTERDNLVRAVSEKDGAGVGIAVENSVDSKDAVSQLREVLNGKRVVIPLDIGIDKVARAGYVEPIFEAGHVHLLRAEWNRDWIEEFTAFPGGKHDDQVDNVTAGWQLLCGEKKGHFMTV